MSAPDMDVIKEIPGYKVILKAVLKSQIQQLVEQLAKTTDEESVILTASVADGTLCHLGSDSGKIFLEDHEDIKSQFLGFCLKRHHKQKQDKEREEALAKEEALARSMMPTTPPRYGGMGPRPGAGYMSQHSPRHSAPHPMQLTRASIRSQGVRHQPYPMNRPTRPRLSQDQLNWPQGQPQGQGFSQGQMRMSEGQVIKIEPDDSDNSNDNSTAAPDSSVPSSPLVKPATPGANNDNEDAKSESSTSTVQNEQLDSKLSDSIQTTGLSLDSDLSTLIQDSDNDPNISQSSFTSQDSNSASQTNVQQHGPSVNVKLEAADTEMDLEITGVELGQRPVAPDPSGSQNWGMSPNMTIQGASGTSADMSGYSQYSYNLSQNISSNRSNQVLESNQCQYCGKSNSCRADLIRHERKHTGERPFVCTICGKGFSRKYSMKAHMMVHLRQNEKIEILNSAVEDKTQF